MVRSGGIPTVGLVLALSLGCQARVAPEPHGAILVELFTSEGCSSCPPADLLLMDLDRAAPAAGTEVIVLSEHVDYWNRLGWVDPFASARFTARQRAYAVRFGEASVYTPQMVVDGRVGFPGSDRSHALAAITEAAGQPKAKVVLSFDPDPRRAPGDPLRCSIRVEGRRGPASAAPAEVFLAVAEGGLPSRVLRGENAGRTLDHTAVARKLLDLGPTEPGTGGFTATVSVPMAPGWNREHLRIVVFVQGAGCGPVLGAAALALGGLGTRTNPAGRTFSPPSGSTSPGLPAPGPSGRGSGPG